MTSDETAQGPDHAEVSLLLGGYVLGGLDDSDRSRVLAHLPSCASCQRELLSFSPVPGLLRRLTGPTSPDSSQPAPDQPSLDQPSDEKSRVGSEQVDGLAALLASVRISRRRRRRQNLAVGVVAALLVLAMTVLTLSSAGLRDGRTVAAPEIVRTDELVAVGSASTNGRAALSRKTWGTSLQVTLSGVEGAGPFRLLVVGEDGATELTATWGGTTNGRVDVTGASSWEPSRIAVVRVVDARGTIASGG